ncbi:MAG: serine/threonine-protein kinase [Planctomycetota bacterium]
MDADSSREHASQIDAARESVSDAKPDDPTHLIKQKAAKDVNEAGRETPAPGSTSGGTGDGSEPADGLVQAKTVIRQHGSSEARRERTPAPGVSGRTPAEIASVLVGEQLNQYYLEALVGGGGMGAVFRALDQTLDRTVALKVIPFVGHDPELQRRFRNEAQNAAKLDHPRIARVFDAGNFADWHYIVFEYIDGINLRDLVRESGVLTLENAVLYTAQVAEALDHAAQRGIVHRDIKPSNLLVSSDGTVKLVDMGLARSDNLDLGDEMTASGVTLGTFDYISPEQAFDPRDADIRSDLYSLGCTLYFMLTGQPPYTGGTMLQKLISHGKTPPPDPREQRPDLPDDLIAVMDRMMAKDAKLRYQNARDLLADLNELSHRYGLQVAMAGSVVALPPRNEGLQRLQYHLPWMIALLLLVMVGGFLELQAMATRDSFVISKPTSTNGNSLIPPGFANSTAILPDRDASDDQEPDADPLPELSASELSPTVTPTDQERLAQAARPPVFSDAFPPPPLFEYGPLPQQSVIDDGMTAASESDEEASSIVENEGSPTGVTEAPPAALPQPSAVRIVTPSLLSLANRVEQVNRDTDGAILVSSLSNAMDLSMRYGITRVEFATPEIVTGPITVMQDNMVFTSTVGRTTLRFIETDVIAMRRSTMLKIGNHRTEFRNLDFDWELSSEQVDGGAMFEINDNRLTQFLDCTFTLANKAMHDNVSFFDVITNPAVLPDSETLPGRLFNPDKNALPLVAIRFDNAIARGEATLIRMDYAAALQLVWNNGLIAITGRLLDTAGSLRQPGRLASPIQLLVSNVTAEIPKGVVRMRLDSDGRFPIRVERQASQCVFLVDSDKPHYEIIGADPSLGEWLELRGEGNAYVGSPSLTDPVLVVDQVEGGQSVTPMSMLAGDSVLPWVQEQRPRWSVRWTNPRPQSAFYHQRTPTNYRQDGVIYFGFRELDLPPLP